MDVAAAQRVLDQFDVPARLQHVRRYVWRNGALQLLIGQNGNPHVCYELSWSNDVLRVGIDTTVPSAIYIRADTINSYVPFAGRLPDEVERALQRELDEYVAQFLNR